MIEEISILIVDDHSIVREGLRLIFETVEEIVVVGEAADGAEGLSLARELSPDVVLMDLRMPGMDGLTAIQHFSAELPDIAVIANTGVKHETVGDVLAIADGCIVGSSLKVDGDTWNAIDPDRAKDFMARVRKVRG